MSNSHRQKDYRYDYDREPGSARRLLLWTVVLTVLLAAALTVSVRITRVRVIGNKTYTPEQIENMVFPTVWDKSTLICLFKDRFQKHRQLPFIQDYDIQLTGPFSCDLVVYEKSIVGYVRYMSTYMYFDKDGIVVESSEERLPEIPEIAGLKFGHIVLNEPLPVPDTRVFNEIMNMTQQLGQYGIGSDKILFDNVRNVSVTLAGGSIEAKLGSADYMDEKLSVLHDMLPELEGRGLSGTLDLSNYTGKDQNGVSSFRVRKP